MSKVTKADIEALTKTLEVYDSMLPGSPITVNDIYPTYRHLFNAEAQGAYDRPHSMSQTFERKVPLADGGYVMTLDRAKHFSILARGHENIPKCAERLAELINKHALQGHIVCPVTPLSTLRLYPTINGMDDHIVYSCPMMTFEGCKAVDEAKYDLETTEGQSPKVSISGEPEPIRHRVGHTLKVQQAMFMMKSYPQNFVQERQHLLQTLLPKGTKFLSIEELPIIGFSRDYLFVLEHPLFKDGSTVELDFTRETWRSDGGKIDQEDVLSAIRYIGPNGGDYKAGF